MLEADVHRWDLSSLLGRSFACGCGVEHQVPVREIILEAGALARVSECCERHLPGPGLLVVADAATFRLAGEQVVARLRAAHRNVDVFILEEGEHGAVADEHTIRRLSEVVGPDTRSLLAVGAGTVNDVTKLASFRARLPYVVCPTAPSMNGFTSSIAAVMSHGVKVTVPAQVPRAIVADLTVLADAPLRMMRAGLGDMLSKPVSNADWRLAHHVRGEYYCEVPFRIVEAADRALGEGAEADPWWSVEGVRSLTEALLLSGISMVVAGSSSPASGGEHLMSHYWDMTAHEHGRPTELHGAQVGVATLVTATLYDKLARLDPSQIPWDSLRRDYAPWPHVEKMLRNVHGVLGDAVVAEARKKWLPLPEQEVEWQSIRDNWDRLWEDLATVLVPVDELRSRLQRVGAPTTIHELGIDAEELRMAYHHARDIRGRFTVFDFADALGVLHGLCGEVLLDSGVLENDS